MTDIQVPARSPGRPGGSGKPWRSLRRAFVRSVDGQERSGGGRDRGHADVCCRSLAPAPPGSCPLDLRRDRLVDVLRVDPAPVTLVFAPAGFIQGHEIGLSTTDVEVLYARTHGWAAGLQIACMAVAGGADATAFVARCDGDDHEVADYRLTEVMAGLPAATRRFMLRTSACTELSIGLAERLSDRADAGRELERLEQRNGDHLHAMEHLAAAVDGEQVIEVARAHGLSALPQRGVARIYVGSYPAAAPDLQRATILARASGRDAVLISCLSFLAGAFGSTGDLAAAQQAAAEAVHLAERRGWGGSPSIAYPHRLLGWMASLRGERETAEHAVGRALDPDLRGCAAPVLLQVCLDLRERHWARRLARIAIGRASEPGEPALLRAILHHDVNQMSAARRELEPVLAGTARCSLVTTAVRAWLLAATIEQATGHITLARERLRTALQLAEPVDLLQPFMESRRYADLLIAEKERLGRIEAFLDRTLDQLPPPAGDDGDVMVRLTPTELEVLRDLPSLLTLQEIAETRSVSVNTVKTHLRAIYRKLDVDGRRNAVKAARSRGLLSSRPLATTPPPRCFTREGGDGSSSHPGDAPGDVVKSTPPDAAPETGGLRHRRAEEPWWADDRTPTSSAGTAVRFASGYHAPRTRASSQRRTARIRWRPSLSRTGPASPSSSRSATAG